ncbi:hypothetical protein DFH06DRAFT_1467471 [Mycena polygramma]|nr:hypothetical protein DFH06DRAFT_1467471 [Mycena polygramma]
MADNARTENPGPAALNDATNGPVDEVTAMRKEVASLPGLVKTLTTKRSRGRKRARDDENDEPSSSPSAKKTRSDSPDAATDYVEHGRTVARFLGMFVSIGEVIKYGTTMDAAMPGDEGEVNIRLADAWKILWQKFPGYHEYLLGLSTEPIILRATIQQWTAGLADARQADTSTVKTGVAHRGQAHPTFAKLLTPMEWAANDVTTQEIVDGVKVLRGSQLPRFVFPFDQVFPVGVVLTDPIWLEVHANSLKGEILLRAAKAIMMGPNADLAGDGYHKGRPGNAKIIGLNSFTPRVVAWVTTQVYFALSSMQEFNKQDGDYFDYEEFFWTIHDIFDDEELGAEIIALWDRVVFGKSKTTAAVATSGPSALAQLKAAKRAAAAATAAPRLLRPPLLSTCVPLVYPDE